MTENTHNKLDLHDGDPWSEADVSDLQSALEHGHSIEEAAVILCRSGTIEDVRRNARTGLEVCQLPVGPARTDTALWLD